MVNRFEDAETVTRYLNQCIILYNQKPYWCTTNNMLCSLKALNGLEIAIKPTKTLDVNDPTFFPTYPDLGFINLGAGNIGYLVRAPLRQWKIGLTNGNCFCYSRGRRTQPVVATLITAPYVKTYLNEYPKFLTCAKDKTGAFCRDYAIKQGKLFYKLLEVGLVSTEGIIQLYDDVANTLIEADLKEFQPPRIITIPAKRKENSSERLVDGHDA